MEFPPSSSDFRTIGGPDCDPEGGPFRVSTGSLEIFVGKVAAVKKVGFKLLEFLGVYGIRCFSCADSGTVCE